MHVRLFVYASVNFGKTIRLLDAAMCPNINASVQNWGGSSICKCVDIRDMLFGSVVCTWRLASNE